MFERPRRLLVRAVRTGKVLARDARIPRPLRLAAAFGVLPLPGPLDEALLVVVVATLWIFYPDRVAAAWKRAASSPPAASPQ